MATKFLEPGGDADFGIKLWTTTNGIAPTVATDFVHGAHVKSIKYGHTASGGSVIKQSVTQDSGTRISFYVYFNALPGATCTLGGAYTNALIAIARLRITSAGVLQLWNASAQMGTNGSTLSAGKWYRISLAYTITSTTVNRFELFLDGVSSISITNATLGSTGTQAFLLGNGSGDTTMDMRSSDHYVDNSNALTDPGNIWVTAKRPFSNGTSNQFTTQIGIGGSGYGSGHAPQVNERALSNTNGWSIQSASKQTEEYTIESASTGDIDISAATLVDYMGWIDAKVGVNSTGNIILAAAATNISLTTTETVFTKIAGSTTYPAGNTDIGMDTNTVNQLFSLYECGIVFAYIPAAINYTQTLTESIAVSDVLLKRSSKPLTETLTLSDTLSRQTSKILPETATLTDTLIKKTQRLFSEVATITDSLTSSRIFNLILSEIVTVTDTFTKLASKLFPENFSLTDTLTKQIQKVLPENFSLSDFLHKLTARLFTESLTISDTFTKLTNKLFPENLSLSDSLSRLINKLFAETVTFSDTLTAIVVHFYTITFTETLALTDSLSKFANKVFTETFSLTDTLIKRLNGLIELWQNKFTHLSTLFGDKFSKRNSSSSDKFSSRGSSFGDKFSSPGTSTGDKFSSRGSSYNDKLKKL